MLIDMIHTCHAHTTEVQVVPPILAQRIEGGNHKTFTYEITASASMDALSRGNFWEISAVAPWWLKKNLCFKCESWLDPWVGKTPGL